MSCATATGWRVRANKATEFPVGADPLRVCRRLRHRRREDDAAGGDGVGCRDVAGSGSRIVEVYVMCATVAGKGGMVRQSEQGEGRGTVDAAIFTFADIVGVGGGAETMVGAGAEDVGVRA